MNDAAAPAQRPWLLGLFAIVLVAALYAQSLGGPFIWDDRLLIGDSPLIRSIDLVRFFTQPFWLGAEGEVRSVAYFRPLVTLSFAVDYWLHGDNPGGYHLTNLGLHLTATALVFSLLRRRQLAVPLAFVLATCWALLPRLTEGAAWISGRTDVMAGVLSLAALWVYRPGSSVRFVLSTFAALLAVLSKESGLAALAALGVAVWFERRQDGARRRLPLAEWLVLLAVLGGYAALRWVAGAFSLGDGFPLTPAVRAQTVLEAVGRYALMFVDVLRPRSYMGEVGRPELAFVVLGALTLAGLAVWARRARQAAPETLTFLVLAFVPLLFVIHLTKLPISVVTADRYLYLPSAALLVALAPALQRQVAARRWLVLAPLSLLVACAVRSYQRIADYTDDGRFWISAVSHAPGEASPLGELASVAYRAGCYTEALELYRRAVALRDHRSASALQNAALVSGILGDHEMAGRLGDALVKYFPNRSALELRRATIALNAYDFETAQRHADRAIALDPGNQHARSFLGLLREIRAGYPAVQAGVAPPGVGLMFDLRAFRYGEALHKLRAMLEAPQTDEAALRSGVEFFIAKGDPRDAEQLFRRYAQRGTAGDLGSLEAALRERVALAERVRAQLRDFYASGALPPARAVK